MAGNVCDPIFETQDLIDKATAAMKIFINAEAGTVNPQPI